MNRTSLNRGYSRYSSTFGALVALVIAFPPSAEAAKRKAEVVCFKKAGKKMCRKRRAPAKKVAARPRVPLDLAAPAALSALPQTVAPTPSPAGPTTQPNTATSPQSPPGGPSTPDCGTSPWVGYTAEDIDGVFRLTGKRTCVPGPSVSFQLRNIDAQPHNLYAERGADDHVIIGDVEPGETKEATTTLSAGEWRLFCNIEGHETMSRTLTVTG